MALGPWAIGLNSHRPVAALAVLATGRVTNSHRPVAIADVLALGPVMIGHNSHRLVAIGHLISYCHRRDLQGHRTNADPLILGSINTPS